MRNFVLFLLVLIKSSNAELFNRQKRFLIFPRSAPTRHQVNKKRFIDNIKMIISSFKFIAGIGIPVDLESQSVTIGYVFKTQYYLPYNASQLRLSETFPLDRDKKSLQQNKPPKLYENWHQKPKATDVDKSRWNFYKGIEAVANARGIEGRPCLLRTICEVAEVPFGELNGILGELMHIMFT